jgi:hypothetical protein
MFCSAERFLLYKFAVLRIAVRRHWLHEPHPALWASALMSVGASALLLLRLSGY